MQEHADHEIANLIAGRLRAAAAQASTQWAQSLPIRHCVIDELLPPALAQELAQCFPAPDAMGLRSTFRERKYVSAQMDRHDARIESALFAFHDGRVLEAVRGITGKADLQPDPELYAGGLSLMLRGHFLNPHIDNSHDGGRKRWRNLNLLYYVTPDWPEDGAAGGDLELWPHGFDATPVRLRARFNRLVIMETHQQAWHSVRPVAGSLPRRCISNYYFGDTPMRADQDFHVTSFRARPEQPLRDLLSRADSAARMWIRRGFRLGLRRSEHRYRR